MEVTLRSGSTTQIRPGFEVRARPSPDIFWRECHVRREVLCFWKQKVVAIVWQLHINSTELRFSVLCGRSRELTKNFHFFLFQMIPSFKIPMHMFLNVRNFHHDFTFSTTHSGYTSEVKPEDPLNTPLHNIFITLSDILNFWPPQLRLDSALIMHSPSSLK